MIKNLTKRALAVALVSGGLGVTVLAAPAYADNAPYCVDRYISGSTATTQTARIYNGCSYAVWAKVVWDWGTDGPCLYHPSGSSSTHTVAILPRVFAGADSC